MSTAPSGDPQRATVGSADAGPTITWHRAPAAVWRRSSDRTLVLCPGHDEPLVLSGAGHVIWEFLDEPIGEDDLVVTLVDATDADASQVTSDVRTFLSRLADEDAVVRRPSTASTHGSATGEVVATPRQAHAVREGPDASRSGADARIEEADAWREEADAPIPGVGAVRENGGATPGGHDIATLDEGG